MNTPLIPFPKVSSLKKLSKDFGDKLSSIYLIYWFLQARTPPRSQQQHSQELKYSKTSKSDQIPVNSQEINEFEIGST